MAIFCDQFPEQRLHIVLDYNLLLVLIRIDSVDYLGILVVFDVDPAVSAFLRLKQVPVLVIQGNLGYQALCAVCIGNNGVSFFVRAAVVFRVQESNLFRPASPAFIDQFNRHIPVRAFRRLPFLIHIGIPDDILSGFDLADFLLLCLAVSQYTAHQQNQPNKPRDDPFNQVSVLQTQTEIPRPLVSFRPRPARPSGEISLSLVIILCLITVNPRT